MPSRGTHIAHQQQRQHPHTTQHTTTQHKTQNTDSTHTHTQHSHTTHSQHTRRTISTHDTTQTPHTHLHHQTNPHIPHIPHHTHAPRTTLHHHASVIPNEKREFKHEKRKSVVFLILCGPIVFGICESGCAYHRITVVVTNLLMKVQHVAVSAFTVLLYFLR